MANDRIVFITGVSRGLGLVLAREFAGHGWIVVGTGRSDRPGDLDKRVDYRQFDGSDPGQCAELWRDLAKKYPGAEFCLVNNAGGWAGGPAREIAPEVYESQMKSIYFSSVFMTQALIKNIKEARIISVISTGALTPRKNESAYGPAKAAQKQFFRTLQKELDPKNYQITNIYPDMIATSGPNLNAIQPEDLAHLIRWNAETKKSYYETDVILCARNVQES